jgi:hypothetical protein
MFEAVIECVFRLKRVRTYQLKLSFNYSINRNFRIYNNSEKTLHFALHFSIYKKLRTL